MSEKTQKSPLGHDPLAWMLETDNAVPTEEAEKTLSDNTEFMPQPATETAETTEIKATAVAGSEAFAETEHLATGNMPGIPEENSAEPAETGAEICDIDQAVEEKDIVLHLDAELTLPNLTDLHQTLLAHQGKVVELDGKAVKKVDMAALQLLLIFTNSANTQVTWQSVSPELQEAVRLCGLQEKMPTSID